MAPDPPALTVATFNIHSGIGLDGVLDLGRIADVLATSGAGIVGLQEVDRFRRPLSEFEDQAAWLAERLGMEFAFGANLDHDPDEHGQPRRQYGTAILSAHPIRDEANTPLPCYPAGEQRGLLRATVSVDGRDLRVLCTHFQHDNPDERLEQAEALVSLVSDDEPALLLGDFNATPDSTAYAVVAKEFEDAWAAVGDGPGVTFEAEGTPLRIDYVFTRGLEATRAEVVAGPASDHWLLIADVRLPSGEGR